jgi:putative ABC transport system substrate-binding protein
VRDASTIERGIAALRSANGGLIVPAGAAVHRHRDFIVTLMARHKMPVAAGALSSYGPDRVEQYRQAAGYVDRILKGDKAGRPASAGANGTTSVTGRLGKFWAAIG